MEHSMGSSWISNLSYSIEWLSADEADKALQQHASPVYDIESLVRRFDITHKEFYANDLPSTKSQID